MCSRSSGTRALGQAGDGDNRVAPCQTGGAPVTVRKSIRLTRSSVRSGGRHTRTSSLLSSDGKRSASEMARLQPISSDDELLFQVVRLALRLQVVHRTIRLIQRDLLYTQCNRQRDMAESLCAAVCDPLAILARRSEEIAEWLGGKGILKSGP